MLLNSEGAHWRLRARPRREAAATAEALATTMDYNTITSSIYSDGLNGNPNDQAYLVAGHEQELNHYNLLTSIAPALATTFYFPTGMIGDASTYATTVNTLVTLEDAFIAAYLIGMRDLSSAALRVLASQIMGVEAAHRAFGRVIAADLDLHSTTGLSGKAEGVDGTSGFAANNSVPSEHGAGNDFLAGLVTYSPVPEASTAASLRLGGLFPGGFFLFARKRASSAD